MVPNSAMTTDSSVIIPHTALRLTPTARNRPISRVRSVTESSSVFVTPRIAMTKATLSSAEMTRE